MLDIQAASFCEEVGPESVLRPNTNGKATSQAVSQQGRCEERVTHAENHGRERLIQLHGL